MAMPQPKTVELLPDRLHILWDDGHDSSYRYKPLRVECQCAHCVDEMTRRRRLDPNSIPEDIQALDWMEVGRYALTFLWNDGHDTGIYPYERLRKLCPCGAQH